MTLTLAAGWLNRQVGGVADPENHMHFGTVLLFQTFLCQKILRWEPGTTSDIPRGRVCVGGGVEKGENLAENSEGVACDHRVSELPYLKREKSG